MRDSPAESAGALPELFRVRAPDGREYNVRDMEDARLVDFMEKCGAEELRALKAIAEAQIAHRDAIRNFAVAEFEVERRTKTLDLRGGLHGLLSS